MMIEDSLMSGGEKIALALRELYFGRGYRTYRMSKFEEYDFYARNKEFLVSDNVITFTDTNGKLMALKPDVTLSIIKNSRDIPGAVQKLFYCENVYRVSRDADSFKEIMQTGLECFGDIHRKEIVEVLELAVDSLKLLSPDSVLELSDLTILEKLLEDIDLAPGKKADLIHAIGEKNFHTIDALADPAQTGLLKQLLALHGTPEELLPQLKRLLPESDERAYFLNLLEALAPISGSIRVDFSVVDDVNYYNGIVFKGFVSGIPTAVLSGGRYDRLMRKLGRSSGAIGFAVYTDLLERMEEVARLAESGDGYLNVALPKGRLGEKVYHMFARAGYECPSILEQNRKLIFENPEKKVRYFWVKPSDVAIYVERGAADIGVAGKDILLEYQPDIYELLDLNMGKCRMAVAAPKGFRDDPTRTLRVATKFAGIAKEYYGSLGRAVDLIHLNGSIELAPILGLSDVIVDIVETGTTLKENNLEVVDTVVPISARLIANKSSYKFKLDQIRDITAGMAAIVEEGK